MKRTLIVSFTASLIMLALSFAVGYISLGDAAGVTASTGESALDLGDSFYTVLAGILLRNTSAALLLFSGVFTAGISTILGLAFMGVYVGLTFRAALNAVGFEDAAQSIILYAPLEFIGFLIAATAGLLPLTTKLLTSRNSSSLSSQKTHGSYFRTAPQALRVFGVGIACILMSAVLEALIIAGRFAA